MAMDSMLGIGFMLKIILMQSLGYTPMALSMILTILEEIMR
jgi:hypothetical protein